MIGNKRILAVIPARGGSKRLPRKNVLNLAGKPLIAWTIEAASGSKYIDRVVVSTDDQEIAVISKKYGADVPFMRSDVLATDEATSIDVVLNTLEQLEISGNIYEYVMLLQPTSPLRTAEHINQAIEFLQSKNADSVVSVSPVAHPIEWMNTLPADRSMSNFFPSEIENKRSQDFPKRYRLNGAIYLNQVKVLMRSGSLINCGIGYAYVMDEQDSIDIDNDVDFIMADVILRKKLAL